MFQCFIIALAIFASVVRGCGAGKHGHDHGHSRRSTTAQLTPPTRPLVWGDLNVIHTTDSHGWLLGHQKASPPEPNYSADFGDFASFVAHMKQIAKQKGVDLLLVDSGDLHDGTGLSDGFPAGGIDAHDSNQFIKQLPYDILAIGNHELYIYNNTLDMYTNFAPFWNGRYLSSNVNITVTNAETGANVSVPVGARYAKYNTTLGRRVTSLGVLFDFTGNDEGTIVQKVEDMVKEQWFAEVITDEPDLFLLVGHMPVSEDNWPTVFNAIRAVHPETPILIFGGHTHIRDCTQFDGRSMALESGRYMETVGWMSVNFTKHSSTENLTFSRRYLDTNRLTYEFHTGQYSSTFDTQSGASISNGMKQLAERFDLSFAYGIAPNDFTISRDPYPSNGSILSLFIEAVPIALQLNNTRALSGTPALFLVNSGSQRFDIFAGNFTKNDQLTASPFTDKFLYVPGVPLDDARQVLGVLNEASSDEKRNLDGRGERWIQELYGRGEVWMRYERWLEEMNLRAREELERRDVNELVSTMGYVTSDSCPGIGDDTVHTPLPFYSSPVYIGTSSPMPSNSTSSDSDSDSDSEPVDLVFVDFIESDVIAVLNSLQSDKVYAESDVGQYSPLLTNDVLGVFAQVAWN